MSPLLRGGTREAGEYSKGWNHSSSYLGGRLGVGKGRYASKAFTDVRISDF